MSTSTSVDDRTIPGSVYKILDAAPAWPLPLIGLQATALDAQDGFVHLSTAGQTPSTAALFFSDRRELWLLRVDTREEGFRWAPTPGCVHLHGRTSLGKEMVLDVRRCERTGDEGWREAMAALQVDGWLVG